MQDNPNIDFICKESGIDLIMPIIRSSEYKHSWIKKAAENFKKAGSLTNKPDNTDDTFWDISAKTFKNEDTKHTSKCPGLQMWHNSGWIMRLHRDIKFKIVPSGECWDFVTPEDTQTKIVSFHLQHSFYPFFENWPKNTMKKIVKLNLPWYARIPKGYKLLQLHPMFLDDWRFTVCNGVYDPQLGLANIGVVPLMWHSLEGEHTLKAGTPVSQFILIPKEEANFNIVDVNDDKKFKKELNITQQLLAESFNRNYFKIKEFWKKYGW